MFFRRSNHSDTEDEQLAEGIENEDCIQVAVEDNLTGNDDKEEVLEY